MSALVRWLPGTIGATASQIKRYGPQAGRLRDLVSRVPTLSGDSLDIARILSNVKPKQAFTSTAGDGENLIQQLALESSGIDAERLMRAQAATGRARESDRAYDLGERLSRRLGIGELGQSLSDTMQAEVVSDYLAQGSPGTYRNLVKPFNLASASETAMGDLLNRQRKSFVQDALQLADRQSLNSVGDVRALRQMARGPEAVRALAKTMFETGEANSIEEALLRAIYMADQFGI
jgi:hypothetical protein